MINRGLIYEEIFDLFFQGDALCKECFYYAFEEEIHKTIIDAKLFTQKESFIKGAAGIKDLIRQSEAYSMITEYTQESLMLRLKQLIKILTNTLSRNVQSNCLDPNMLTISKQDITQISSTLNVLIQYRDVLYRMIGSRIASSSDFEWKKIIKVQNDDDNG